MPRYYNLLLVLASVALFSFGSGLVGTIIALKIPKQSAGVIMSIFYLGMLVGSVKSAWLIHKFGQIKLFSLSVIGLGLLNIVLGLSNNIIFWYVIRFCCGYALALCYVIVESYLLDLSSDTNRVRLLSFYGISLYGAQSLSQFYIPTFNINTFAPFLASGTITLLAILPIMGLKGSSTCKIIELRFSKFVQLYKIHPASVLCCLVSGAIIASIYGLLPNYLVNAGLNINSITRAMIFTLSGSVVLRYPIGHFSDRFNRQFTLLISCVILLLLCVLLAFFLNSSQKSLLITEIALFLFGGFLFALYPIGMAYLCESKKKVHSNVDISQGLMLAYCIGCVGGPVIISWLMALLIGHLFCIFGLFVGILVMIMVVELPYIKKYLCQTDNCK